jgi:hypothetical protein
VPFKRVTIKKWPSLISLIRSDHVVMPHHYSRAPLLPHHPNPPDPSMPSHSSIRKLKIGPMTEQFAHLDAHLLHSILI